MKPFIRKRPYLIPLFILLGAAAFAFFGWLVMTLWNLALVPAVGANLISFWQAMGLLLLSRILVGGFGGRKRHGRWQAMREKWMSMSPEEKEKFRSQCGQRWSQGMKEQPVQESAQ